MGIKKMVWKGFILLGIVALMFQGCKKNEPVSKDKIIGLQLYSLRDDMLKDPKATVAKVGEMGYAFVEAAGYKDGKFYEMTPLEFKKLCEDNGLQFLGSHTGQDVPTAETWDKTMAWWDTAIDAHAEAGVKWIVQPSMNEIAYDSLEGLKQYMTYFNEIGKKCKAKGIQFGYHNHDKEFTTEFDGKPLYDYMLELSDPDNMMFQLDLYWIAQGGKDALAYFEKYPGRFMLWHIKDEMELGESGEMDFNRIFSHKKESGFQYGIVEVERYNFTPIESVKKSYDYLQTTNF